MYHRRNYLRTCKHRFSLLSSRLFLSRLWQRLIFSRRLEFVLFWLILFVDTSTVMVRIKSVYCMSVVYWLNEVLGLDCYLVGDLYVGMWVTWHHTIPIWSGYHQPTWLVKPLFTHCSHFENDLTVPILQFFLPTHLSSDWWYSYRLAWWEPDTNWFLSWHRQDCCSHQSTESP
jgi:hypothetical protein